MGNKNGYFEGKKMIRKEKGENCVKNEDKGLKIAPFKVINNFRFAKPSHLCTTGVGNKLGKAKYWGK